MKKKMDSLCIKKLLPFGISFLFVMFLSVSVFAQLPKPSHIVIVIEENHAYSDIIGNSSAPYINGLVNGSLSSLFTQSYGITHPSQPNYLLLFSGDNQGVTDDNVPSGTPFNANNLGAELLQKGYTFMGYSEDLPSVGYTGASSGSYKRKHNPWVNWQDATTNGIPSSLNVPLTDFPSDYSTLPTISFVIPNQNNDMHDGSVSTGDSWLQNNLDGYIQWAKTNNSLFILTTDEDDGSSSNRIATLFVGQMVKKGSYNIHINHLNVLRTIEEMYGLNYAGSSNDSSAISSEYWLNATDVNPNNDKSGVPSNYRLLQNYPNPFNPSTNIKYDLPKEGLVTLRVYDILGKEVKTLVNEFERAGTYKITFNASDLPSGIYFYRLSSKNFNQVKKFILLK
ncbi:MAG TPA: alkaline phosphatase family protein [Ignavibacteriaceae bacterium]|nr:alkaline phosphatase family protein [Ignavibacteriaceae bacterium]